jgi:hypothetical protein
VPATPAQTRFDCGHAVEVMVDIDSDVEVPAEIRGLGKCGDCMEEDNLVPISGIQPQANGRLVLDSIFLMPIE